MFPTGAGENLHLHLTLRGGIDHGLHFGPSTERDALQVIHIATEQLSHRLVGVG